MALYTGQTISIKLICEFNGVPMSTCIAGKIHYRSPSGVNGFWTATVNNTDGSLNYTSEVGDIDESGKWALQPEPTLSSGVTAPGTTIEMPIRARFT